MKRTLAILSAAVLLVLPARAQQALRVDTSGKPTSTLDLTGSHVVALPTPPTSLNASVITAGQLAPARLGTGTPTSTTILRGDGTWAGTTSTGNTVAATGSLLMGDSAGNAKAVANGADLYRVLKARRETASLSDVATTNLLPGAYQFSDTSNNSLVTYNADGTLTIPPNRTFRWWLLSYQYPNLTANQQLYGYAVAVGDAAAAAGAVTIHPYAGYDDAADSVDQTLAPGVYRSAFPAKQFGGNYFIDLNNTTGAAVTIYAPIVSVTDGGLSFLQSHAELTALASQPVNDFDFTKFPTESRIGRYAAEKLTTVAADSVNGSSGNAGTLYSPKATAAGATAANGSVFGLFRGSLFRDSLPLSTLANDGTSHGVVIQDVALGQPGPLPIVSALDPVTNSAFTPNGDGSYSYLWTPADSTIANDGYQNVYIVEINTATVAAQPIASRQRMVDVTSANVSRTQGSCCIFPPGTGSGQSGSATQWKVTIEPSDGIIPGSGSYRYEVVSRYAPARFGSATYPGDTSVSGLELIGSSWGYGSIASPNGLVGDRLAILHCSSHGAVLGGGSLSRSVFYEQSSLVQDTGNGAIQVAWYTHSSATNLRWQMDHCLFYTKGGAGSFPAADHIPYALISHTSDGSSYQRGDISDCAFLGGRYVSGALKGTAIDYENVTAGTINRVYAQGFRNILGNAMPLAAEVKNSVFQDCQFPQVGLYFHDNIVLAQSATDPASTANYPYAVLLYQNGANASNNILWSHGLSGYTAASSDQATGIAIQSGVTAATAQRNIIIIDPANKVTPANYLGVPSGSLAGFAIDYNLVINLTPAGICTTGGTGNTAGWSGYTTAYTTLDQHSLYLDLSGDPRGIKALFVDPINGDFRWAQTDVARQAAAFCKANNVGPASVISHWPTMPTVDEAVRLLSAL